MRLPHLRRDRIVTAAVWGAALLVLAGFAWLLGDLMLHAAGHLSWSFLVDAPRNAGRAGGIGTVLVSTLLLLGVALVVVLPVGVGAAIWLAEYGPHDGGLRRAVRLSLDTLAGVPSIVFGLFGNAFFSGVLGLGFSIAAGGLTLACMVLPVFVSTAERGLSMVNDDWRTAAAALVGPSGCGKTSLLWALNRLTDLVPGATVRGRIRFEVDEVLDQGLDVLALRRRVGMIAQRLNPFPLSIRRNFELPLREHGARQRDEIEGRMERALRNLGLWVEVQDRLNAPALALSGGQQRLCIARAPVLEPPILLMDEPCSALDAMASGVVEDLIDSLRGRYSVAIVTHNLAQARRLADDVAVFWTDRQVGKLVEFGACEQLFSAPREPLRAAYLSGARG